MKSKVSILFNEEEISNILTSIAYFKASINEYNLKSLFKKLDDLEDKIYDIYEEKFIK